jgi:hypothetical protein
MMRCQSGCSANQVQSRHQRPTGSGSAGPLVSACAQSAEGEMMFVVFSCTFTSTRSPQGVSSKHSREWESSKGSAEVRLFATTPPASDGRRRPAGAPTLYLAASPLGSPKGKESILIFWSAGITPKFQTQEQRASLERASVLPPRCTC